MATPVSDAALKQRLRLALNACAGDALWQQRGQWLATRCLVALGDESLLISFNRGQLAVQEALPPLNAWDFAIRGTARAWSEFWQQPPAPGWHDLLALSKRGELRLEGNLQPLMAHLQYFKDLLALPRDEAMAPPRSDTTAPPRFVTTAPPRDEARS